MYTPSFIPCILLINPTIPTHESLPVTFQETQESLQTLVYFHISYSSLPDNPLATHSVPFLWAEAQYYLMLPFHNEHPWHNKTFA